MLHKNFVRFQLELFKPFASNCSLKVARDGQDKLGALLTAVLRNDITMHDCDFGLFKGTMVKPKDELFSGIVLYLHGGGYTCGTLEYARSFGATLASKCGVSVLCPAYRLAPESPYPAALDDALTSYKYLLDLGYSPKNIILSGESAGGGLIYALCLKLRELKMELPAGIIAVSPWTDLTMSGESFETNKEADPSMTKERLKFYADCYVHGDKDGISDEKKDEELKKNPFVSPLFANLDNMPPSLMFVGGDEIMLCDTTKMYDKLKKAGNSAKLIVAEGMWHGYVLHCLKENRSDFDKISRFLRHHLLGQKKLHWMRLDNVAKIYPAIKTKQWSNYFRVSATLNDEIDISALQTALDVTVRRFPSISVRLRRGMFWYYLEEVEKAPDIEDEKPYPLYHTPFDDIRKCAFRVLVYKNRIATEFFHAITDGSGGMIFLKTLVCEYIEQKYKISIPAEKGVLNRLDMPREEEFEDCFPKYSGTVSASRKEPSAFHIDGTPEPDDFCTDTTLIMDAESVAKMAKERGVTVTAFLCAVLMKATINIQNETVKNPKKHKDVRILIPVNLRALYNERKTLRNFALYVKTGVDVRLGEYTIDELCKIIHHTMGSEVTQKQMSTQIAANVNMENMKILQIVPLFIKNIAMKAAFNVVGETKTCFAFSNLGIVDLPEQMLDKINRMDFVLNVQAHAPYNIGTLTYKDKMYMNFIRNIKEPLLEQHFYELIHSLGISVKAENNARS